jgi:hypothetical protein
MTGVYPTFVVDLEENIFTKNELHQIAADSTGKARFPDATVMPRPPCLE